MSPPPSLSAPAIWEATLDQLLLRVTRQNYDTWLRNTAGLRFEATTLVVSAPTELACDWLATRMRAVISQALTAVAGPGLGLRFVPAAGAASDDPERPPLQPSLLPSLPTPLNPRYTFETFLEGEHNRLALHGALDLTDKAESSYSPLFLTGPSGNGKTHLLHAIAHRTRANGVAALLVSAEQFLSEFTSAIQDKMGPAFRARYRDIDLLLIDDVHHLLGKKATMAEFYQTVAGLQDHGRRVVVAGDHDALMAAPEPRGRAQPRWSLVARIGAPNSEDRLGFIRAKLASQNVSLPKEIQDYLALRVRSSIRELESAINRVSAQARISGEPLTIDLAARALQPVSTTARAPASIQPTELIDAVCRYLEVTPEEISSAKRTHALVYARHVAMYLLRQEAGLTYAAIAHLLGKKDHSTVVSACGQLNRQLSVTPSIRADIDAIRASLHNASPAA